MRSRALAAFPLERVTPGAPRMRRPSAAALVFLCGRDADARLRELASARTAARPVLGALALAVVRGKRFEQIGYRSLGDYGRERLGIGARTLRDWARVWERLAELPRLRGAVISGEVGWGVARRVVDLVTPETEVACFETVRGRTVRAVEAILAALRRGEGAGEIAGEGVEERDWVRVPCTSRDARLWTAAVELARLAAGEALPIWACAERIAAEAANAIGGPEAADPETAVAGPPLGGAPAECEHGLREVAFLDLPWRDLQAKLPAHMAALLEGVDQCTPLEIDRRLRAALAFFQEIDFETGRILRQMQERRLFAEIGFEGLARYVEERLDLAPRTARRLVVRARAEHRAPAVATAFRRGEIHGFQADVLLRVADLESARRWVDRAQRVTLRRLEDDVEAAAPARAAIAFRAPRAVARLFLGMVARAGSLLRLLAHAIRTWVEEGKRFRDYADFERDGYRCTAPGCTARRSLESHHVWFRSRGGPDAAWNRTTLCAFHHRRGVHAGVISVRGRAPDKLVFELGGERFASRDVRMPSWIWRAEAP